MRLPACICNGTKQKMQHPKPVWAETGRYLPGERRAPNPAASGPCPGASRPRLGRSSSWLLSIPAHTHSTGSTGSPAALRLRLCTSLDTDAASLEALLLESRAVCCGITQYFSCCRLNARTADRERVGRGVKRDLTHRSSHLSWNFFRNIVKVRHETEQTAIFY